ncbi:MAG: aspartate--tRNA(Asn) ligase [Candidatus Shapirobacteria bacterium]
MTERTLVSETPSLVGQKVLIKGWVNSLRSHGALTFADIRDRTGILQIVGSKDFSKVKEQSAVELVGTINSRDSKYFNDKISTGKVELSVESFTVLSMAQDMPFDVHQPDLNVSLPTLLDNRIASLKHSKTRDIFTLQATITSVFRDYLNSIGFIEFQAPTIVAAASEGGSQVFPVDYFGYKAYLAQSPQLYKQIMVGAYERVYTVAHAYRAEPSVTTRHLTEYVGLDVEMGFINSWQDVVMNADNVIKQIFKVVQDKHGDILAEYGVTVPKTVEHTPQIKLKDALELITKRTGRDVRNELDMDPEGEREICRWAYETTGSELVFITHFYTKKRAWYSHTDPENPEETLSFDLIGRGVEWISGSQRIHEYDDLVAKIIKVGQKPEDYEIPYVQAFRYGMPPEGGYCIGLERLTMNILGLDNLRKTTLYPRDMERVDARLSVIGKKIVSVPTVNLHDRLMTFLDEKVITYRHLEHEATKTSQESANARGTRLEQGAKALLMFADSSPILVVISAATKLDNSAFKTQFKVKDLRMATAQEVESVSGAVVGAVPPFGNLFNVVVYADQKLLLNEDIAFNAGDLTKSVIMKSSDWKNLVNPTVGDFAI